MKKAAIFLLILIGVVFAMLVSSCKTRQVQKETTTVHKEDTKTQETALHSTDSSKTVSNTTGTKKTILADKDSASSTIEAVIDSVKTKTDAKGNTTTTYYPKPGTKTAIKNTNIHNAQSDALESFVNSMVKDDVNSLDEKQKQSETSKIDSTKDVKNTQAQGSGTTWAKYGTIVGGAVILIAIIIFLFVYKRK